MANIFITNFDFHTIHMEPNFAYIVMVILMIKHLILIRTAAKLVIGTFDKQHTLKSDIMCSQKDLNLV